MQLTTDKIKEAVELLNSKSYESAVSLLRSALVQSPTDADALQLFGVALKHTGRLEDARDAMLDSLAVNAEQSHVLNNLGGVLLRLDDVEQARECFESALKLKRDYKEAWRNLALAFRRLGKLDEAEQAARHAVSIDPEFSAGLATLGQIRLDMGRADDAVEFLKRATELAPTTHQHWHNLGAALRITSHYSEASSALHTALELAPRSAETYALLGAVFQDLGRLDASKEAFRIATEAAPDYEEAHFALNQILWVMGEEDEFLKSYINAEEKQPDASGIRCAHAQTLLMLDRSDEAEVILRDAEGRDPDDLRIRHLLGRVMSRTGKHGEAIALHEGVVKAAPHRPDFGTAYARSLMHHGDFGEALRQLEACDPAASLMLELDQEILALKHTCAKGLNSPLAEYLYDYKKFVRAYEIPTPDGFSSVAQFNEVLKERLNELHIQHHEPIEQSLRGGTQTQGRLLEFDDPVIRALRASLGAVLDQYLKDLVHIPDHPFELGRPDACRFAGSWSVRLRGEGFHKNHIHGRGWLSSAYYVSLPGEMHADTDADSRSGWLKFGQPNALPGADTAPDHWIKPEEGTLAVFPSYMWHGTERFASDETRMTVAFDIQSNRPTLRQLGRI